MLKYTPTLENYEALQKLFSQNDFRPELGVEVGVREGNFSEYMLRNNPKLALYCVDPYTAYEDVSHTYTQEEQDKIKDTARVRLAPFEDLKVLIWVYLSSAEAARKFYWLNYQRKFDFVFVDGDHSYPSVLADLTAWAPLVREGGILCGHDSSMISVKKALKEWAGLNGYDKDICHTGVDSDVWAIKLR